MTIQQKLSEIKRLTAEVEAELSRTGGVGAAPGNKDIQIEELRKLYHKNKKR